MIYKYNIIGSLSHLASGNIIYNFKGASNFPVRLAHEIFNRCLAIIGDDNKLTIYDPCCGGGYLMTVLGFLNAQNIEALIGSDISTLQLEWASKNLGLLNSEGLATRKEELRVLIEKFEKLSHRKALKDIVLWEHEITQRSRSIDLKLFQRDILDPAQDSGSIKADIVMMDVPYGRLANWSGSGGIDKMLDHIMANIKTGGLVAMVYSKDQKRSNDKYSRKEKFKVGRRIVEILSLN